MAKKAAGGRPRDEVAELERVRQLIDMMKEHGLSEIDLQNGDQRIRLARGTMTGQMMPGFVPPTVSSAPAGSPAKPAEDDKSQIIFSPMVGTFYSKPNPDAKPYVSVGDIVSADTIVCSIEAMKMFNEIPAGLSGRIVEVLVASEDPVDVNKPLFRVSPA
jgi:acetyl-CoA carboxylase biotin carboxyl carrier protein